ncbi:MAG: CDP-glycerol glycerophosphotransferase family protein [Candidatus Marinimicrobia bacterium]|nr:CDP-glycerol glycerophosphotransferase family protein [Candidatus Neomarinimicrobiota bacterium]
MLIKVLFNVEYIYYLPQFLPVAKEMEKSGEFEIFFTASNSKFVDYAMIKKIVHGNRYHFIESESEGDKIKKIRSENFDVTVFGRSAHAKKYCSEKTMAVLLYHGIGFKKCYYTDYDSRIDVRYVESEYRREQLLKYNYRYDIVVTGFPKLDLLLDSSVTADIKINNQKPVLLYAPTFYPSSIEHVAKYLPFLSDVYNVVIKPHQFTFTMKKYEKQKNILIDVSKKGKDIYLIDYGEFNIIPYYKISDVLLSDYSSTVFEYLATEKPIILCDFYKPRWKHRIFRSFFWSSRMDKEIFKYIDFAFVLKKPEDIYKVVDSLTEFETKKLDRIRERKEMFLGKVDGKTSIRIVEDIIKRVK